MTQTQTTDAPVCFETRFGSLQASEHAVIEFPEGIPGFEKCRRWVLIASDELAPVRCLLGLDASRPSFLTVDPTIVDPDYRRVLGSRDSLKLGGHTDEPMLWLVIVTLAGQIRGSANLKAPIVINASRMIGYQTILDDPTYPVDRPI